MNSDERLDYLMNNATQREARQVVAGKEVSPVEGVTIKSGKGSLSLSVRKGGTNAAFAQWLDEHLAEIIQKSFDEFTAVNPEDGN